MFYLVQLLVQIEFRYLFPVHRRDLKLVSGGIIQIGVLLMISFRTETVHLINIQWILGRELYTRLGILEFWNSDTVSGQMATDHHHLQSPLNPKFEDSIIWHQLQTCPLYPPSLISIQSSELNFNITEKCHSTELQSTIVPYPGFYSNIMKPIIH